MDTQTRTITLTDALARRIKALQTAQSKPDLMLRVEVLGGGCSGFQYKFSFASDAASDDHVFDHDGIRVLVDDVSLDYLNGSIVDYVEDLVGASFQIKNPNATSSCGCGTSFAM
jgi:iron-sulfur cluster insertion protein